MARVQRLLRELPPLQVEFPTAAEEFTLFPELPLELRRRIWQYASLRPRDITLHLPLRWSPTVSYGVQGHNHAPALLCVSKESRAEALRYYTQCREYSESSYGRRCSKTIFVNWNIDRCVQVCSCSIPLNDTQQHRWPTQPTKYNIDRKVLGKIQHFAIDFASCSGFQFSQRLKAANDLQRQGAHLESVTIMIGPKRIWSSDTRAKLYPMTDEGIQRELMELYICEVRSLQTRFQWVWPYQVEYRVKQEVVLLVTGEELKEYQGAFKFDIARRAFL